MQQKDKEESHFWRRLSRKPREWGKRINSSRKATRKLWKKTIGLRGSISARVRSCGKAKTKSWSPKLSFTKKSSNWCQSNMRKRYKSWKDWSRRNLNRTKRSNSMRRATGWTLWPKGKTQRRCSSNRLRFWTNWSGKTDNWRRKWTIWNRIFPNSRTPTNWVNWRGGFDRNWSNWWGSGTDWGRTRRSHFLERVRLASIRSRKENHRLLP